ncbi:MAG: hypothetical protein HOV81_07305 [Kofleriaceae bacterium]|nr:hypothetical protein [Kofleriaceae bacterium]
MLRNVVVAVCLVSMLRAARADEADPGISSTAKAGFILELLIPDFRVERSFTEDTTRYTLAVPFAVHAGDVVAGSQRIGFNHVAEIQYVIGDNVWRGSLGERFQLADRRSDTIAPMPIFELGGVFGADGYGGAIATGLTLGDASLGSHMGFVVRYVVTNRETRADVGFDFQIPLNGL